MPSWDKLIRLYVYIHTYICTCIHTKVHKYANPCQIKSNTSPPWNDSEFLSHTNHLKQSFQNSSTQKYAIKQQQQLRQLLSSMSSSNSSTFLTQNRHSFIVFYVNNLKNIIKTKQKSKWGNTNAQQQSESLAHEKNLTTPLRIILISFGLLNHQNKNVKYL